MRPIQITTTALTNDPNGIAEAQTIGSATDVALDGALVSGGVATMGEAQIITIDSTGNDSGITFTVTGTDADGTTISEVVTGGNATTADTTAFFKTVTQVATSGATAANIIIGPLSANGGVTKSFPMNWRQSPYNQSHFIDVTGTINLTVQHTEDAPEDTYTNSFSTDATWRATTDLTTITADAESNIAFPVRATRVLVNSGTGTAKYTAIQGQNG